MTEADEIESRRVKVMNLRVRRMTVGQMATALSVSTATISRDLQWITDHWKEVYGMTPALDPAVFVGETIALYQETERLALVDYQREVSAAGNGAGSAKAKMICLRTAIQARERQVALLQDLRFLDRSLGTLDVTLPQAAEIRRMMQDAHVTDDMLTPPGFDDAIH